MKLKFTLEALKKWLTPPKPHAKPRLTERELINRESVIGRQLFGPVRASARREFFCLDPHTWIWHEEWTEPRGVRQTITTRYDIRGSQIIKTQNNQDPEVVHGEELQNLLAATSAYYRRVASEVYNRPLAY